MAEPLTNTRWHRLLEYHKAQLSAHQADLCFVGDSLTEGWSQEGAPAWREMTRGLRTMNLARAKPRVVVLLMGTNNLSADQPDSPESVVRAITAAIEMIRKASPDSKIVVLSLPPNGVSQNTPLQQSVIETNRLLAARMPEPDAAFLDLHTTLAEPDGRWKPGCTLDGTHLSAAGYSLAAKLLIPALTPLLKPTSP